MHPDPIYPLQKAYQNLEEKYNRLKADYDTIKQKERYLQVINDFAVSILHHNTVYDIVWAVAKHAIAELGFEDCVIYLLDEHGKHLIQKAAHGPKNPQAYEIIDPIVIPVGQGIVGSVAASGIAEVISDTRLDSRYIVDDDIRLSELAVPMIYQGRVIGVIDSEHHDLNFFTEAHKNIITTLASMASTKIVNALTIEKLKQSENTLRQYRDDLEILVTERTKELSSTLLNLSSTQEKLIEAKEVAERANQAKSEFLSNMSHELRTPLNGILGYAQILKRNPNMSNADRKGLDIIHQSGDHLMKLINEVLDLSKIEARKMDLNQQTLHLDSLLSNVASLIQMSAEEKDILFVYDIDECLPVNVKADEKRLFQVLINLLSNAIKFTPQGTVTLRVNLLHNLSEQDDQATIRFEIIDTGIGMTSEQLTKIFLPFEQVGGIKQRAKGTGLGLAITEQLVDLMGSQVYVESEIGLGSRFWFDLSLPVIKQRNLIETKTPPQAKKQIVGYEGSSHTVLVIDDREENRFVLSDMLQPLGFKIICAENGEEGVDLAHQMKPDLILTDLMMPIMNGFEAVQKIRLFMPNVPIIAISASVFDIEKERSLKAGCNAFLPKPVDEQALLTLIGDNLQLTWVYDSTISSIKESSHLIPPPLKELKTLHELAYLGMATALRGHIEHIAQLDNKYAPFVNKVALFSKEFEDEKIMTLVEQYLD